MIKKKIMLMIVSIIISVYIYITEEEGGMSESMAEIGGHGSCGVIDL